MVTWPYGEITEIWHCNRKRWIRRYQQLTVTPSPRLPLPSFSPPFSLSLPLFQVSRRFGCVSRPDRKWCGLHFLPQQRDHVPCVHQTALHRGRYTTGIAWITTPNHPHPQSFTSTQLQWLPLTLCSLLLTATEEETHRQRHRCCCLPGGPHPFSVWCHRLTLPALFPSGQEAEEGSGGRGGGGRRRRCVPGKKIIQKQRHIDLITVVVFIGMERLFQTWKWSVCRCQSQPERMYLPLVPPSLILPYSQRWVEFTSELGDMVKDHDAFSVCLCWPIFQSSLLREFLLTKLINAEISCYKAERFSRLEVTTEEQH